MSSNTTFSSEGNFNRPKLNKLKPQKDIVNTILFGSTLILLLIPFFSSISHKFGGNFKYNAPNYFSIYIIIISAIFVLSIVYVIKNFDNGFMTMPFRIMARGCNVLYITNIAIFIVLLINLGNDINYIKNKLWDFSNVNSEIKRKETLDLCITAYFGDMNWLFTSIFTYCIATFIVLAYYSNQFIPKDKFGMQVVSLIFKGPVLLLALTGFWIVFNRSWKDEVDSGKANVTCPTAE